jgi:hypothetical protein
MDHPFSNMKDPLRRADRYQKVAGEYSDFAKAASSPYLRTYFQRTAAKYRLRAEGELQVLEREDVSMTERIET